MIRIKQGQYKKFVWCRSTLIIEKFGASIAIYFLRSLFMAGLIRVMIRPPSTKTGSFDVVPGSVRYAQVLLLFSDSAVTNTRSNPVHRCGNLR